MVGKMIPYIRGQGRRNPLDWQSVGKGPSYIESQCRYDPIVMVDSGKNDPYIYCQWGKLSYVVSGNHVPYIDGELKECTPY